jgi:hypothetical protein
VSKVDVTTLDMVENTASSPDKDLDAPSELASLVLYGYTTVDSQGLVLIGVMLNLGKHVLNLQNI